MMLVVTDGGVFVQWHSLKWETCQLPSCVLILLDAINLSYRTDPGNPNLGLLFVYIISIGFALCVFYVYA